MSAPPIKICGVTRSEDAEVAVELGAALIGLNFYPASPRALGVDEARRIADSVRGRATLVGVFVDLPPADVEEIGERVGLGLYQLHGDESARDYHAIISRSIKAFRIGDDWSEDELEPWRDAWGFLVESRHPSLYGGTGESWAYERLAAVDFGRPTLLAGGIRPETARAALEASGAWGLDVCSGVESRPGVKDRSLLERLFAEF